MKPRIIYMTGGQLAVALAQVGWGVDRFSDVTGTPPRRVNSWLHGEDYIPRWVPLFMTAMTVQPALDLVGQAHQQLLHFQNEQMKGAA